MKVSKSSRIERVGVQIVGLQFEEAGYIFREQPTSDYGIDAHIELIDGEEVTGQLIALQIKSGDSWFKEVCSEGYVFRGDKKHLSYWLDHSLPVLIVLCDSKTRNCYWQTITSSNVIDTEKALKIIVPKYQKITPVMYVDLKRLVNKLAIHKNYTIASTEDLSHNNAKRYSLRVILNKEHTQAEIINLIKTITTQTANCEYHRSERTREHWGSRPAHVVWINIYPSAEDERNNNILCGTEWFSDTLASEYKPLSNYGEEVGQNIKVNWNNSYLTYSRYNSQNTMNKEEFIIKTTSLVKASEPHIDLAFSLYIEYESGRCDIDKLKSAMTRSFVNIDEIYSSGTDLGLSPFECKDLSNKFQSLIAYAHNVFLPFSGFGKESTESQIIFNIKSQVKYYREAFVGFEFELKKVQ